MSENTEAKEHTMTDRTQQTPSRAGEGDAGIDLEQSIEAVSRGVPRALQAPDDVRGQSFGTVAVPAFGVGIVFCPPPPPHGPRDVRARRGDRLTKGG